MKKLLILLAFMFTFAIYGQNENSVWVDTRLTEIVDEYISEAKERGIDVVPQLLTMDYIGFSNDVRYPVLGITTKDQKNVLLGQFCMLDPTILKVTMFHELTHAIFAREHSECSEFDIMKEHSPKSFRVYENKDFWEERSADTRY